MRSTKVRKSQLLAPFGIGAMLDLPDEALMLMGLENWPTQACALVKDDRLAARLGVANFREPAITEAESDAPRVDQVMNFTRFPRWYFCPRCRQMEIAEIAASAPPDCKAMYKPCLGNQLRPPKMVPVRFVIACKNGHIDDFPWISWAHTGGEFCQSPKLRLKQTGGAGLAGLRVVCTNDSCSKLGATLTLAGRKDAFKSVGCSGHRPWLGRYEEVKQVCEETPQMIQRGASNAYFSRLVTSILIPPFSKRLFRLLDSQVFQQALDTVGTVNGKVPDSVFDVAGIFLGVPPADLRAAYESKQENQARLISTNTDEESFRYQEYEAFKGKDLGSSQDDLRIQIINLSQTSNIFQKKISCLSAVEKLVETRCLTGFTRLDPSERLAKLSKRDLNWLPAIAGTGEGIFLELDKDSLNAWAASERVAARCSLMNERKNAYAIAERRSGISVTPQFVLLHTLAHALSRRLSFDCGYGSSSIRERIYCSDTQPMTGILLYTSEAGSEGTLGGLVSMAEPSIFESLFIDALNDIAFCSNDPLCEESNGQGPGGVNLAACQGCSLIPETSCEESNFFLDRVLLCGSAKEPNLGFFRNFFEKKLLK